MNLLKKWKMREYHLRIKRRNANGKEKNVLNSKLRLVHNRIKQLKEKEQ